jgi:hypothetical protein
VNLDRVIKPFTQVDWRRETIYLLTAAMEIAWFTPWYLALIPATAQLPPGRTAVGLFVIMVIPTYGIRLLGRLFLKPYIQRLALVMLLVLTCLLALRVFLYAGQEYKGFDWLGQTIKDMLDIYHAVPDWFIIVMSTLFLWWRGISLAQRRPSVRSVAFSFYLGIVSFIGFVLLVNLVTREDPSVFIPVFFFYALMALAATRMDEMRGRRGAMRSPFGVSWLLSIAGAVLIVVLLGTLLGALLTGKDLQAVVQWIAPLLLLFGVVLGALLAVFRIATDWLLGFLHSMGVERATEPLAKLLEGLGDLIPDGSDPQLNAPPGLGAIRLVLMVGLIAGLGALVIWMMRHQGWGGHSREDDGQESVFSSALLLEHLRELVETGKGRLTAALGLVQRRGWRGLFAALTIRRIYAQMLRLAAHHGYPRAPFQTPYEYESTAARAFPDGATEVRVITEAYVAVHYGEVPESDAELQQVRACWERLKESMRTASVEMH